MSTPPMSETDAIQAAGATRQDDGHLQHCGQPMHTYAGVMHRCTVCQITIQKLDSTTPASVPAVRNLWLVRQSDPSAIQP